MSTWFDGKIGTHFSVKAQSYVETLNLFSLNCTATLQAYKYISRNFLRCSMDSDLEPDSGVWDSKRFGFESQNKSRKWTL